jgi:hypothetical protein
MKPIDAVDITGFGIVCPAGLGLAALEAPSEWRAEVLPHGNLLRVDSALPELVQWQKEARLRRASVISLTLLEAAHQALRQDAENHSADMSRTGMVYVSYTGCLVYSCRFYEEVVRHGRRYASPMLFPETVYNSPASHAASVLGISGACYTLVGDSAAWVDALKVAMLWLDIGECDRVVVVASEEVDPILLEAYRAAGWHRKGRKLVVGEGAGALVLRRNCAECGQRILRMSSGHAFRNVSQARSAAGRCLSDFPEDLPVFPTAAGTWHEPLERAVLEKRSVVSTEGLPRFGDAGAAGAAWHTMRAMTQCGEASSQKLVPFWGLNHQVSALQVSVPPYDAVVVGCGTLSDDIAPAK